MGKRTEHAPGTFSWVDLATTDPDGAKDFYAGLFGWEYDDQDIGDGGVYTMVQVEGVPACAISAQIAQEKEMGVPPHWNNYVTVESADDSAAKAKDLGGKELAEAFDVFDSGRMAVLADPAGAVFSVWQPNQTIGAEIVNVPGALTWNELHTTDVDGANQFYGGLFGWTTEAMDTGGGPAYSMIKNGDRTNGGITDTQPQEPPNWLPYFATDNLDEAMSKSDQAGGKTHAGPIPMPQGKIAVMQDPQGAFFALWEGELAD